MRKLSLQPDADMRWIYNPYHRDYDSDRAKNLRERRDAALSNVPPWMIDEARFNDAMAGK